MRQTCGSINALFLGSRCVSGYLFTFLVTDLPLSLWILRKGWAVCQICAKPCSDRGRSGPVGA